MSNETFNTFNMPMHTPSSTGSTRSVAPSRPHEDAVIEELRADPEYAIGYLNAVLADGDQQELMLALRRVAKAFGEAPNSQSRDRPSDTSSN